MRIRSCPACCDRAKIAYDGPVVAAQESAPNRSRPHHGLTVVLIGEPEHAMFPGALKGVAAVEDLIGVQEDHVPRFHGPWGTQTDWKPPKATHS